jgi:hypothetical protein
MKHILEGRIWPPDVIRKDFEIEVTLDGYHLDPAKSQRVYNHSPDGFEWGYGGSGPAQLALAIMLELTGSSDGYQELKDKLIAGLPHGKSFRVEFEL